MFKIGLCSVTFRNLSVEEIIKLSIKAGVEGIEWGGDVHVKPGDIERASEVGQLTKAANIEVTSFGSYYRTGDIEENDHSFEEILTTAQYLQAPAIRVWAGSLGSQEADEEYRLKVVDDARRIAELAAQQKISIHFEYHGGTLTDTKESAVNLLETVDHPNVYAYWQPAVGETIQQRIDSIQEIYPWLSNVHLFHWEFTDRLPFEKGSGVWKKYLEKLTSTQKARYLLMEFVKDDRKEQFLEDIQALKKLLHEL